jgi:hypothetical protein
MVEVPGGHVARAFTRTAFGDDGKEIEIEVVLDTAILDPRADIAVDAGEVAGIMGAVGELIAVYTERVDLADAEYRAFRGTKGKVITGAAEGKAPAEWKVKDEVEADPGFLDHQRIRAGAEADLEWLRNFLGALKIKAQMIRVRADLALKVYDGATLTGDPGGDPGGDPAPAIRGRGAIRGRNDRVAASMAKGKE